LYKKETRSKGGFLFYDGIRNGSGLAWEFPENWSDQTSFQSCWQLPEKGKIAVIATHGKNLDWKILKNFCPFPKNKLIFSRLKEAKSIFFITI
jgi:nitrate reductase beta subunit